MEKTKTSTNKATNKQTNAHSLAKRLLNYWNIRTITGKIVWLSFTFLVVLFATNTLTLYQNQRTTNLNIYVEEVRSKLPVVANALISSLNRSISLQKSYWMTGEIAYKKDRDFLWKVIISKQIKELIGFKQKVFEEDNLARLDSIDKLLPKLAEKQRILDKEFEQQSQHRILYAQKSKLGTETLKMYIEQEKELNHTLNDLLEKKDAEFKTVRQTLIRLSSISNQLLESELKQVNSELNRLNTFIIIATIIAFIIMISLAYSLTRKFQEAIQQPAIMLNQLADGELIRIAKVPDNEFSDIVQGANTLSKRLKKTSLFALEIGEGRFDTPFEALGEQDMLGNALLQMSNKLQKSSSEDIIRSWTNEGLSRFVMTFRENKENLRLWAETIIWQVVRYIEANQGCFYILNEDNPEALYLELLAGYGVNEKIAQRSKIVIRKRFAEGLVGQCYKEAKTIFMTEVPADYTQITSSLGKAKPRCVLLVPLKLNEKIEGVIEISAIKLLEKYKIEFIERLAENIAANLLTIKANDKTQKLLLETQKQAEILRDKETEMRQNVEELQTTQEQMQQKSKQLEFLLAESQQKEFEIKLIKEEIENAKKTFEIMADSVPGVIFQYKKQKGKKAEFLYASNGVKEVFGVEPQMFLDDSDNFVNTIHPEYVEDLAVSFSISIKAQSIWDWQGKIIRPDGSEAWVTGIGRPSLDKNGITIYSGMFTDITNVKKTEESLAQTLLASEEQAKKLLEQEIITKQTIDMLIEAQDYLDKKVEETEHQKVLLDAVINNTQDSIILIDTNYRVMFMNNTLKKRYAGTQYEKIGIGSYLLDALGAVKDEWKAYYDRALAGESYNMTVKSIVKGENKYRQYYLNPVKQDDKIIGVSVFSREVTEIKDINTP